MSDSEQVEEIDSATTGEEETLEVSNSVHVAELVKSRSRSNSVDAKEDNMVSDSPRISRSRSVSMEASSRKSRSKSNDGSHKSRSRSGSMSVDGSDRSRSVSRASSRKSRSNSRSGSRASSAKSKSNSRSVSRASSRRSRRSGSRSVSRSQSRSVSGSRSKSGSRSVSKSASRSKSRSLGRSRSASTSSEVSAVLPRLSISRSPSRTSERKADKGSKSDSESSSDEITNKTLKKTNQILNEMADSSDEEPEKPGPSTSKEKEAALDSDDEFDRRPTDDIDDRGGNDFDKMMQRKKAENSSGRRKKKSIDVINDNDDAIAKMIADMRVAAAEDRDLNNAGKPATKKMGMLRLVLQNLRKVELQMAFIEANILTVMTDWLAPMPDKSLPSINISATDVYFRTEFLRILVDMKIEDLSRLKESGIGKAVMYLYRHPREERSNRHIAGQLINTWARPIFNKRTDFAGLTKEERREQDAEIARRIGQRKRKAEETESQPLKPGDPGWIARARVPMVENATYVARPVWQTDAHIEEKKKAKGINLLEKHKRKFAERKRMAKTQSLCKISLEGNRMKEF